MNSLTNTLINSNKHSDTCNCGGQIVIDTSHGIYVCTSCGSVHGQVYV
jgi:hypothetical protein